jgi:hypothetical protein
VVGNKKIVSTPKTPSAMMEFFYTISDAGMT